MHGANARLGDQSVVHSPAQRAPGCRCNTPMPDRTAQMACSTHPCVPDERMAVMHRSPFDKIERREVSWQDLLAARGQVRSENREPSRAELETRRWLDWKTL